MSLFARIFRPLMIERPARKHDYAGWARQLAQAGAEREAQYANSADSEENRQALSHVIGIERWAQKRASVALGEPLVEEEYEVHRPGKESSWEELQQQFISARAQSVTLAEQLASKQIPITTTVKHNQFEDVTMRGWLRYISMHADFESKAIK